VCNALHDPSRRQPKAAKRLVALWVRASKPFSWDFGTQYVCCARGFRRAEPAMLSSSAVDPRKIILLFPGNGKYLNPI